jgi:uncharacterized protein with von Willebrand factor type A (vWA) domain
MSIKAYAIATAALLLWGCGPSAGGPGSGGAGLADRGATQSPAAQSAGGGPPVTFMGLTTTAATVVFLVDRSGSMMGAFDDLRREVMDSVKRLDPRRQGFQIILFSEGRPMELDGGSADPATQDRKQAAAEFMGEACAVGQTDPAPALSRAFDVLAGAGTGKKAIFFLTDAGFPDNAEVLQLCRKRNPAKDVRIFALLCAGCPNQGEPMMRKLADESGGEFKFVKVER